MSMAEIECQVAEFVRNLINKKNRDVLDNPIALFGAICDSFISQVDFLIRIKTAAISDVSKVFKNQLESNSLDCQKLFDDFKEKVNQEGLNIYLKILFQALDVEDNYIYSQIENIEIEKNDNEKKVFLEKYNEKSKTADDYYELAKAQKSVRGIVNQSTYLDNLSKAAEMGNREAILTMARYYIKGKFVDLDIHKGINLLKRVADDGDATVAYELYNLSKRNMIPFEEAFRYLKIAANGGLKNAFFDLGMVYYENGSSEDYVNAVKWFEQACEVDDMYAYYQLALCYRFGHGVKNDGNKAMELLKKAAELGHYKAKEIVGG
jgi:hypothetical protein